MVAQDFVRHRWCPHEPHRMVHPEEDALGRLGRYVANEIVSATTCCGLRGAGR
jgi:hypothetical protein